MKRARLARRKRKTANSSGPSKAQLDKLCREVVLTRDGWKCRKCGAPANQWCHIYSRRYLCLRWDPLNAWAGCAKCHWWWHDRPLDAGLWILSELGEEAVAYLRDKIKQLERPDFEAQALYLKQKLERIT
jgi:hypothetical protein